MKNVISGAAIAAEPKSVEAITAAIARGDDSEKALMSQLKGKAQQFGNNAWEMMMGIAGEAAGQLADMARKELGGDEAVETQVIAPLTALAESIKSTPEAWLAPSPEGTLITAEMAAGLLKTLHLLRTNTRMRMEMLEKANQRVEKSVMSGAVKVVIDAKVSDYTNQPLKPLSKRDLTTQIERAVTFLSENPEEFTIF